MDYDLKTESGYFNTLFYFKKVWGGKIEVFNGLEGRHKTNHIQIIHRASEFNPKALLNISNTDFGVGSFILPPKIEGIEVERGNTVVIPDFTKNIQLGIEIINSNPDVKFRVLVSYRDKSNVNYEFENAEVFYNETDLRKIFAGTELSLFVSDAHYETFGLFPLESLACGIPCIVSDRYNQPFIKKTKLSNKESWVNFRKNTLINSQTENELYLTYHWQQFEKFKELIKELTND